MTAAEMLARVRGARPQVAGLARAVSLAVSVDVALARRLRRELLPDSDVTAETDLWSSPLVQSRRSGELTLRADVLELLWQELEREPAALERTWQALDTARASAPPLVRLEERLAYLGIRHDTAAIGEALGAVIKAMLDDEARRRDLAAWSARALARLPAPVRETDAARVLASAARGWVVTPTGLAELMPTPEGERLAARLRPRSDRIGVRIRRVGDTLEVGGAPSPPSVIVELPADAPTLIVDEDRVLAIDPRVVTAIPVLHEDVMLGSTDGQRWLLTLAPKMPDLDAVAAFHGRGGLGAAYLVAPSLAVTSARLVHVEEQSQSLTFGTTSVLATVAVIDEDADIALLRLDTEPPVPVLELETEARKGEVWQVYPLPAGPASESGRLRPGARDGRWMGTIAAPWPAVVLRPQDELPERVLRPGMPIFRGDRVLGHLRGEPDGGLRMVSARLIKWWLQQVGAQTDHRRFVVTMHFAEGGATRPGAVVWPGAVVVYDPPGASAAVEHSSLHHRAQAHRLGRVGKLGVYKLEPAWKGAMAEIGHIQRGDLNEETTLATAEGTWRVSSAGIRSSSVDDVDLAYERVDSRPPSGAALFHGDRLVGFLVGDGGELGESLPPDLETRLAGFAILSASPAVWVVSIRGEAATPELVIRSSVPAQLQDRIVVYGGPPERQWPVGIYEVTDARYAPNSPGLHCRLLLSLPPVSEYSWRRARLAESPFPETPLRSDVRDVIGRIRELHYGEPVVHQAEQILASRDPEPAVSGRRVVLQLPERISTAGLLATSLATRGRVRLFGTHHWGGHEVSIHTQGPWPEEDGMRVRIVLTNETKGPLGVDVAPEVGDSTLLGACMGASRSLNEWSGVGHLRDPEQADLTIGVRALPGLPRAWAYRRGVRYLIAVLEQLDADVHRHVFMRVHGSGAHDLGEVQMRLRPLHSEPVFTIAAIDSETDLVEVGLGLQDSVDDILPAVARVFDAPATAIRAEVDALYGHFGVSDRRSGRRLAFADDGDRVVIEVRALDGHPVRGYVTFYAPNHVAPAPVRVRASEGVARCTLPRERYTVGAVIEDEGIALECHVLDEETP